MTLTDEIFEWAESLPAWQQRLIGCLRDKAEATEEEMAEVEALLLAENGQAAAGLPTARAVERDDFDTAPTEPAPKLRALRGLSGVNAIAPDQSLEFEPQALSIVYGENAAGKTGYTRALKRICRSVDRDSEILPNVFGDDPTGSQSAAVEIATSSGALRSMNIDLRKDPPPEFAAISLFDADCADNYVAQGNAIAFTPSALQIFDRLARAQNHLRKRLDARIQTLEGKRPKFQEFEADTEADRAAQDLGAETDLAAVEKLADLSDEEKSRAEQLRVAQAARRTDDLSKRVAALRLEATNAQALAEALTRLREAVSDEAAGTISELRTAARAKAEAARIAREEAFADQKLEGVGGPEWRELWEAARRFYEHGAGPDGFPPKGHDALCPLCQQELDSDARARLSRFDEYVKSSTASDAKQAGERLEKKQASLSDSLVDQSRPSLLEALRAEDPDLAQAVEQFVDAGETRLHILREKDGADELPPMPVDPGDSVRRYSEARRAQAEELARSQDATHAASQKRELDELEARIKLVGRIDDVRDAVALSTEVVTLRQASRALSTRGVTDRQKRLAESVVTNRLKESLEAELAALQLQRFKVDLDARGALGNTVVQVRFEGEAGQHPPKSVLSQGEQRALALAYFLAEVTAADGDGGIILDDPVSSLDHPRRELVAKRLAKEAGRRQVIVFTHDLVFFVRLTTIADENDLDHKVQRVWSAADAVGLTDPEAPWQALNVKKRIRRLRDVLQNFPKPSDQGPESYRRDVQKWYEELRESWERAVEETLFAGVITRFEPAIHTRQLKRVPELTRERLAAVDTNMTHCSKFAHDPAVADEVPLPSQNEMRDDLNALIQFVDQINQEVN